MLKDHSQLQLSLSPYQGLYDAIIPADHLLRRIKENIDFSKVKYRKCPQREKCRVGRSNAKTRSYSITQASEKNLERFKFEESEYFQERMKIRHRIEEKSGELKEAHGLRKADSRGLFAMHLQMYFTAFTANVKRIVRLEELAME